MRLAFEIIYEDDAVIAVNKPAGWLVIPDRQGKSKQVLSKYLSGGNDIFIVHRLDKDTSGIVLFAKTHSAHKHINDQFVNRQVEKTYECLSVGFFKKNLTVDQPLGTRSGSIQMIRPDGKKAVSHFGLIEQFNGWCHLSVNIETGRTHQIRVHAQFIGNPIVADPIYGDGRSLTIADIKAHVPSNSTSGLMSRVALHAKQLVLTHPISGQKLSLTATLPKDFRASLNQLSKWRKMTHR